MFTKASIDDYENLCKLDVLGVTDIVRDDSATHQKSTEEKQGWLVRNWIDVERRFYFTTKPKIG